MGDTVGVALSEGEGEGAIEGVGLIIPSLRVSVPSSSVVVSVPLPIV